MSRYVLVVDEDADQLQTLCRGLTLLGIPFLAASSAAEGLRCLEEPSIEVLLVDVTFPKSSGAGVAEQARALRPELKLLVVTGLVLSPEARALKAQGATVLQRPFCPLKLAAAITAARG